MSTVFKVKYWVGPFNGWVPSFKTMGAHPTPVIDVSGHIFLNFACLSCLLTISLIKISTALNDFKLSNYKAERADCIVGLNMYIADR